MEKIVISEAIRVKLASAHDVSVTEVHQCFANRTGKLLADLREEHATDPPTRWFIAPTNKGRLLKVCYVPREDYFVRTCYEPNEVELAIYRRHGDPSDF